MSMSSLVGFPQRCYFTPFHPSYSCHMINRNIDKVIGNSTLKKRVLLGISVPRRYCLLITNFKEGLNAWAWVRSHLLVLHTAQNTAKTPFTLCPLDRHLTLSNEQPQRHLARHVAGKREGDKGKEVAPQSPWEAQKNIPPTSSMLLLASAEHMLF